MFFKQNKDRNLRRWYGPRGRDVVVTPTTIGRTVIVIRQFKVFNICQHVDERSIADQANQDRCRMFTK